MGLLRRILRTFLGHHPNEQKRSAPIRYWVVHDKFPSGSEVDQIRVPIALPARKNEVRALINSIPMDSHQVMVQGCCHVVDGDSIFIGDASIRLFGIDAPEFDQPFGNDAKWALIHMCKGKDICAVLERAKSYDRIVATCYLPDGRDLSAEMVKLGQAVDWPKFSGGKYRQFEAPGLRNRLWRCEARQKGQMPPSRKSEMHTAIPWAKQSALKSVG